MSERRDCGIRRDEFQSAAPSVRCEAGLIHGASGRNVIKLTPPFRVYKSALSLSPSPLQFFSRCDYVSRNTIEFSVTIDGEGLSTARERSSRSPETLVFFDECARVYVYFAIMPLDCK